MTTHADKSAPWTIIASQLAELRREQRAGLAELRTDLGRDLRIVETHVHSAIRDWRAQAADIAAIQAVCAQRHRGDYAAIELEHALAERVAVLEQALSARQRWRTYAVALAGVICAGLGAVVSWIALFRGA